MNKNSLIAVIIIAAVILALGLLWYNKDNVSNKRTISSNGISTMKSMPDLTTVYIRIDTSASTADESKDQNSKISEAVMVSLLKIVENKDIETQQFNIYPEYDWSEGKQKLLGYKTTNSLKVKLTDFTKIGDVIDAAIDSGASGIDSINFEISDDKKSELKKQVLEKASQDAREKAESVAKGLNAKLGKLVSVSAADYDYRPYSIYTMEAGGVSAAKEAATNVNPQELEVSANVQVTFEIY